MTENRHPQAETDLRELLMKAVLPIECQLKLLSTTMVSSLSEFKTELLQLEPNLQYPVFDDPVALRFRPQLEKMFKKCEPLLTSLPDHKYHLLFNSNHAYIYAIAEPIFQFVDEFPIYFPQFIPQLLLFLKIMYRQLEFGISSNDHATDSVRREIFRAQNIRQQLLQQPNQLPEIQHAFIANFEAPLVTIPPPLELAADHDFKTNPPHYPSLWEIPFNKDDHPKFFSILHLIDDFHHYFSTLCKHFTFSISNRTSKLFDTMNEILLKIWPSLHSYGLFSAELFFEVPVQTARSIIAFESFMELTATIFQQSRLGLITKAYNEEHFAQIKHCRTILCHTSNLNANRPHEEDRVYEQIFGRFSTTRRAMEAIHTKFPKTGQRVRFLAMILYSDLFLNLARSVSKGLIHSRSIAQSIGIIFHSFITTIFDMEKQSIPLPTATATPDSSPFSDDLTLHPIFNPLNHYVLDIFPSNSSRCPKSHRDSHQLWSSGSSIQNFIQHTLSYLRRHDQYYLTEGTSGYSSLCVSASDISPYPSIVDNRYNPINTYKITPQTILEVDTPSMYTYSHIPILDETNEQLQNEILHSLQHNQSHTNANPHELQQQLSTTAVSTPIVINSISSNSGKENIESYTKLPYAQALSTFIEYGQLYCDQINDFFTNKEQALYTLYHHVETFAHTVRRASATARLFIYIHLLAMIAHDYFRSTSAIAPILPLSLLKPILTYFNHFIPEISNFQLVTDRSRFVREPNATKLQRTLYSSIPLPFYSYKFNHPFPFDFNQLLRSPSFLKSPTPELLERPWVMYKSIEPTKQCTDLFNFQYNQEHQIMYEYGVDAPHFTGSKASTLVVNDPETAPNKINFLSTFGCVFEIIIEDFSLVLSWLAQAVSLAYPSYTDRLSIVHDFGIIEHLISMQHRAAYQRQPNSIFHQQPSIGGGLASIRSGRLNNSVAMAFSYLFSRPFHGLQTSSIATCFTATFFESPSTPITNNIQPIERIENPSEHGGYYFYADQNPYRSNVQKYNFRTIADVKKSHRDMVKQYLIELQNNTTYNTECTALEKDIINNDESMETFLQQLENDIPDEIVSHTLTDNQFMFNTYSESQLDQIARALYLTTIFFTFQHFPLIQYTDSLPQSTSNFPILNCLLQTIMCYEAKLDDIVGYSVLQQYPDLADEKPEDVPDEFRSQPYPFFGLGLLTAATLFSPESAMVAFKHSIEINLSKDVATKRINHLLNHSLADASIYYAPKAIPALSRIPVVMDTKSITTQYHSGPYQTLNPASKIPISSSSSPIIPLARTIDAHLPTQTIFNSSTPTEFSRLDLVPHNTTPEDLKLEYGRFISEIIRRYMDLSAVAEKMENDPVCVNQFCMMTSFPQLLNLILFEPIQSILGISFRPNNTNSIVQPYHKAVNTLLPKLQSLVINTYINKPNILSPALPPSFIPPHALQIPLLTQSTIINQFQSMIVSPVFNFISLFLNRFRAAATSSIRASVARSALQKKRLEYFKDFFHRWDLTWEYSTETITNLIATLIQFQEDA